MMPERARSNPRLASYVPWLALLLILAILAGAIFVVMRHHRALIVQQVTEQDGLVLFAASRFQIDPELAKDPELRPIAIQQKALEATGLLTNIIAMRLFDSAGNPQFEFPVSVRQLDLPAPDYERAKELKLASEFRKAVELDSIFEFSPGVDRAPLVRAVVPLQSDGALIAVAEFFMDGRNVAAALRTLDQGLWRYGTLIFLVGGGIISVSLVFAFARLQKANALLEKRTASLLRANHELNLAAKTSAVGAITAHLLHDLKSPLFGLQTLVAAKESEGGPENEDWNMALSTTERMQKMISDVARILQEEKTGEYELSIEEMLGLLRRQLEAQAREAGIALNISNRAEGLLNNREANIVMMVLTNLARNAIQALPSGGEVTVSAARDHDEFRFEVADNGPGLPEHIQATLFTPSRSTKARGTGLGLAISKQLANHLGAELNLKKTSALGTIFELCLPARIAEPATH